MQGIIERLKAMDRAGTCRTYTKTYKSFSAFCQQPNLSMQEITQEKVEEYEAWLRHRNVGPNTISFYMRILRATYNRAVRLGMVTDIRPFSHVSIKAEKTSKRAIMWSDIKRLKELDLSRKKRLEWARDIFLFLFYCRGMSFIDAAYLRMSDIYSDNIVYRRHKTHQQLIVGLNDHIRSIIEKYHPADSPFILPILSKEGKDQRKQYEAALRRINNALKKLGEMIELSSLLTTYVSRHSWATIAKTKGVPLAVISDALGHDSEATTQVYLASISSDEINRANDLILNDL